MLDVILDCFGALLLFGQAAWFLVKDGIVALPPDAGPATDATKRKPDRCST